jgi:hypothetical protein
MLVALLAASCPMMLALHGRAFRSQKWVMPAAFMARDFVFFPTTSTNL